MGEITLEDKKYSIEAFESMIRKLDNVVKTLKKKQTSVKMIANAQIRLDTSKISLAVLLNRWQSLDLIYSTKDIEMAKKTLNEIKPTIEKLLPKYPVGTSQYTIAIRRLRAMEIADNYFDELIYLQEGQA